MYQPPYALHALAPYISSETICFLSQALLADLMKTWQTLSDDSVDEVMALSVKNGSAGDGFVGDGFVENGFVDDHANPMSHSDIKMRYAIDIYYHAMALASMCAKKTKREIGAQTLSALYRDFGSYEKFYSECLRLVSSIDSLDVRALWLLSVDRKLKLISSIFDNPLQVQSGHCVPLFVINLNERAYYLDYRNRREDYVRAILDYLLDWQAVENRYITQQIWRMGDAGAY